MDNLGLVIESIIDPTREDLDLKVFDKDGDDYHMKSYTRSQLEDIIDQISDIVDVNNWFVKGSILSRQWLDWSDLDVVIEIEEDMTDDEWDQIRGAIDDLTDGMRVRGTNHPIEIFPQRGSYDIERAEGIYDPKTDEWLKGPYDIHVDIGEYMDEFKEYADSFDLAVGSLERDLTDYFIMQVLENETISALSDQAEQKVMEIDGDVAEIIDLGADVKQARRDAFDRELKPDEIISKQELPANVIQKLLERYKYISLVSALKNIRKLRRDPNRIDAGIELERLKELFDIPSTA